jgi:hypothetical protein
MRIETLQEEKKEKKNHHNNNNNNKKYRSSETVISKTQNSKRERDYTYCIAYLSPHPYSILTRLD